MFKLPDVIMIISILIAPIIGVIIGRIWDSNIKKLELYKIIVKTRTEQDGIEHNNALKDVYMVFNVNHRILRWKNKKKQKILDALKLYVEKKNIAPNDQNESDIRDYISTLRSLQDNFLNLLAESVGREYKSHEVDQYEIKKQTPKE